MTEKESTVEWHPIIESIFDDYLPLMSGKIIEKAERERSKFVEFDYYCLVKGELKEKGLKQIVRPFDHLKAKNLIEFKSLREVLNESIFRQYVGRALILENPERGICYKGQMTLTILTTMRPETLIAKRVYAIEQINDWKYVSHWIEDLDIVILVQKGMRGKKEGEALALLQILEGDKAKQLECWQEILSQDLPNIEAIKKIIQKINREGYMNLVMELKKEGKIEGKIEEKKEIAINMLKKGMEIPLITEITGLAENEVKQISKELKKQK